MPGSKPPSDRLESWKEIAAYVGRTERTARRWEQAEGLPVHRLSHSERASIYAYKSELDAWRTSRATEQAPDHPIAAPPSQRRPSVWIAAGIPLAVLVGAVLWYSLASRAGASPQVVAILPFATHGSAASDADLGVGIAEAIAGHLAGAPDVRVRPFTASLRHSRASGDPAAIGQRMGADLIVTGRVRLGEDDVLHVNVVLVEVSANTQVWGAAFDTPERSLGPAQERMALDIREHALRHAYGPSFEPASYQPSNPLSRHPEALKLYLRARAFARNPGRSQIQSSIGYLLEAVRLDPDFTAAYEALAIAHTAVTFFGEMRPAETIGRSKTYAARALELNSRSARAHMALAGASTWHDFDYQRAEHHFRAAFAADPRLASARNWYAELLIGMHRFDEALAIGLEAERLDPGWLEVYTVRGNVHLYSRNPEAAVPIYLQALDTEPNHGLSRHFLAQAYLMMGRTADAIRELGRADVAMGHAPFSRAALAYALARDGRRAEAESILAEVTRRRNEEYYPAFALAIVHMGLGNIESALDWLERAVDERLVGYYPPNIEPAWDPVRSHPRFQDLLRRAGLPSSAASFR